MRVILAIGAAIMAVPAAAAQIEPADHAQLLQLAERMDRAWTAGDANANARLFAADATARFGDDPLGQGRAEIGDQFHAFFKNRPAGLRHVTAIERVELLAPDLTFWDAEVRVERRNAAGEWATLTRIRNVTLAIRQPGGWRIQAVRAFPTR